MLAGFIEPTAGIVEFDDRNVTHLPPNKRNTGMVFQSYALWPHMSVLENVSYGLKIRKLSPSAQRAKALDALAMVHMDHLATRKPNELSGGQQQRVALARAIVVEPDVLLLDEPLSNLDAKLRLEMRSEIRRICTTLGMTTVYVTHDQKEALSIADSMAILRDGKVVQVGSPQTLYQEPNSKFVAEFLGETNFVAAGVVPEGLKTSFCTLKTAAKPTKGVEIICSIRPEAIEIHESPAVTNAFSGICEETIYLGEMNQHHIRVAGDMLLRVIETNPKAQVKVGKEVHLSIDPSDVITVSN